MGRVAVIDVAGNAALSEPFDVVTANGTAPCATSAPGGAQIDAGLGASGRRTNVLLPYGRRIKLAGRVRGPDGAGLAGARVDLIERSVGSKSARIVGALTAGADGRVRFRLPRGPSRDLWLGPGGSAGTMACSRPVRVRVKAGVVLSVRPRTVHADGRIRFRGRLRGGPGRRGVAVAIYAVGRRGRDRVPVAVLRTGAAGRFRFNYRFRRSFAPFTYRFRVQAPKQRGYPYAAGWSHLAVVRVVR